MNSSEPVARALIEAIRGGDTAALARHLESSPEGAKASIQSGSHARSLLHIATDAPGHFPRVAETIALLVRAGADPNARFVGPHTETPLHWAASNDDVEALDALLDHGAGIDAGGGVIGGGTPLLDACAFGQWKAARRLVERGAKVDVWSASSLGLLDHIDASIAAEKPDAVALTRALWGACHGGQKEAAAKLFALGADASWLGWDGLTPLGAAKRSGASDVVAWLLSVGAR